MIFHNDDVLPPTELVILSLIEPKSWNSLEISSVIMLLLRAVYNKQ